MPRLEWTIKQVLLQTSEGKQTVLFRIRQNPSSARNGDTTSYVYWVQAAEALKG